MKAIRITDFGSPDVLKCIDMDSPICGSAEVRVKVAAASVNPIDYKIREGSHLVCPALSLPTGLGFDFSGEVIECGADVSHLLVGDRVIGIVGFPLEPRAYQQEFSIDATACLKIDTDVESIQDAAAIPLAGLTAWQAVHVHAQVKPGQKVLINGGAGGVGCFAIQLAKFAGATVYATASSGKHELLTSLGADQCIDYHDQPLTAALGFDAVIDLVGGDSGVAALKTLKGDGLIVTVPSATKDQVLGEAETCGVAGKFFLMDYNVGDLQQLAELFVAKKLKVVVAGKLSLAEAAKAHELIESGRTTGKLLLLPH